MLDIENKMNQKALKRRRKIRNRNKKETKIDR
jgi:hypothetical protein